MSQANGRGPAGSGRHQVGPLGIGIRTFEGDEGAAGLLVTLAGTEHEVEIGLTAGDAAELGRTLLAAAQALCNSRRNWEFEANSGPLIVRETGEVFPSLKAYLDDYTVRNPLRLVWEAINGVRANSLLVAPFTAEERRLIAQLWDRLPAEGRECLQRHFAQQAEEEVGND